MLYTHSFEMDDRSFFLDPSHNNEWMNESIRTVWVQCERTRILYEYEYYVRVGGVVILDHRGKKRKTTTAQLRSFWTLSGVRRHMRVSRLRRFARVQYADDGETRVFGSQWDLWQTNVGLLFRYRGIPVHTPPYTVQYRQHTPGILHPTKDRDRHTQKREI